MRFPAPRSFVLPALVLALGAAPSLASAEKPTGKGMGLGGLGTRAPAARKAKPVNPKKEKAIRRLLVAAKATETGDAVMTAMRQVLPGDDAFWETWTQEFFAAFQDELVTIYDEHLDLDEIQALTRFYESEVGQRILSKQRAIAMDSAAVGQALGMKIVQRMMEAQKEGGAEGAP